jgi:hypothetical protein
VGFFVEYFQRPHLANLTISPAHVKPVADSTQFREQPARILSPGGIITAGQVVYYDPNLQGVALADADALNSAQIAGIAMCAAYNFQMLVLATGGEVQFGTILTPGITYVVSTTPGLIFPITDLATGDYTAIVGVAKTTSVMKLSLMASQSARV